MYEDNWAVRGYLCDDRPFLVSRNNSARPRYFELTFYKQRYALKFAEGLEWCDALPIAFDKMKEIMNGQAEV